MNPRPSTEQNALRASRTSEAQSSNPVTRGLSGSRQHADPVIGHAAHAPTCSNQLVAAL